MAFSSRIASFVLSWTMSLDRRLAEGAEHAPAEAADEALDADEADALDLAGGAVEEPHAGAAEDLPHLVDMAAFVVVVAEDGDHRHRAVTQILGEDLGLLRLAEIGEVAGQHEHVGGLGDLGEELADRAPPGPP